MAEVSAGLVVFRLARSDEPRTPAGGMPTEPAPPRGAHPGANDRPPAARAAAAPEPPHRSPAPALEVLCGHMGGPFWARKDERAWSFPKGVIEHGEEPLAAARREFAEELGRTAPPGEYRRLGEYRYASGKVVVLYAVEADLVIDEVRSTTFEMEWPPRSGQLRAFPEVDRAAWFDLPTARGKLVAGQAPALDDLAHLVER